MNAETATGKDKLEPVASASGTGQAYVQMPQLSDRCGGSSDDVVLVPVPDGVDLPGNVIVVRKGQSVTSNGN